MVNISRVKPEDPAEMSHFELIQTVLELRRRMETLLAQTAEAESRASEAESMALTDALTGIGSRRFFDESMERQHELCKRNGEPFSLLMLDIDFFKRINDTLGHDGGDKAIRKVVEILKSNLRASDLLARYGGEEFAIILPDTDNRGVTELAEKLRAAVEAELKPYLETIDPEKAQSLAGTISVGIATARGTEDNVENILVAADRNLYAAKYAGRNKVIGSMDVVEKGSGIIEPAPATQRSLEVA